MVSELYLLHFGTNFEPDADVMALVQRLDGLPLALATTGSYLD